MVGGQGRKHGGFEKVVGGERGRGEERVGGAKLESKIYSRVMADWVTSVACFVAKEIHQISVISFQEQQWSYHSSSLWRQNTSDPETDAIFGITTSHHTQHKCFFFSLGFSHFIKHTQHSRGVLRLGHKQCLKISASLKHFRYFLSLAKV